MSATGRRRVVISGMGAVTPCGLNIADTWANIRAGRSGVSRIEGFGMPEGTVTVSTVSPQVVVAGTPPMVTVPGAVPK